MSAIFIFEIKGAKKTNFQFLKGPFLRNGWTYEYVFWRVFRDLCEASKKYNFGIFFKISKSYNNLNVKSCLKLNVP